MLITAVKLMGLADTVVALKDGRITHVGRPDALFAGKQHMDQLEFGLQDQDSIKKVISHTETSPEEGSSAQSDACPSATVEGSEVAQDIRRRQGDWSTYSYYFSSSGRWSVISFLLAMAAWIFCTEFAST